MSLNNGLLHYLLTGTDIISENWHFYVLLCGFIALTVVASYLLGSVNSAIIISRAFYKDDIRKHGSGNAGLTNMLRTYGKGAAGLTLLGDMLKTALAVFIAGLLLGFKYTGGISVNGYCYLAGLCAVIGHIFPVYYGFKGGKGVLATATMALIITPLPFAILITLFIIIVAISQYVSLGSVCVASLYPVAVYACIRLFTEVERVPVFLVICTVLLAITVVWCHRENLKRLASGTERKLSFGKKENK